MGDQDLLYMGDKTPKHEWTTQHVYTHTHTHTLTQTLQKAAALSSLLLTLDLHLFILPSRRLCDRVCLSSFSHLCLCHSARFFAFRSVCSCSSTLQYKAPRKHPDHMTRPSKPAPVFSLQNTETCLILTNILNTKCSRCHTMKHDLKKLMQRKDAGQSSQCLPKMDKVM